MAYFVSICRLITNSNKCDKDDESSKIIIKKNVMQTFQWSFPTCCFCCHIRKTFKQQKASPLRFSHVYRYGTCMYIVVQYVICKLCNTPLDFDLEVFCSLDTADGFLDLYKYLCYAKYFHNLKSRVVQYSWTRNWMTYYFFEKFDLWILISFTSYMEIFAV